MKQNGNDTILVTGGTGFTGKRVLPLLQYRGSIRCLVRPDSDTRLIDRLGFAKVVGDLSDPSSLQRAMEGCSGLINIASMGFGHAPAIVETAVGKGVRRAVFVSTTAIFTKLPAPSKKVRTAAEKRVMDSSLDWTILRPTMIYGGADDRNMARLLRLIRLSPIIPVPGDGRSLQQPIHVEDLAGAIVNSFFTPVCIHKAYNLSGAYPLTFNQIIRTAAVACQKSPMLLHFPLHQVRYILRLYEKISKAPFLKEEQVFRLEEDKAFSHGLAAQDFGFSPRPFDRGIVRQARESIRGE